MNIEIILAAIGILVLLVLIFVFFKSRKKKLSSKAIKRIKAELNKLEGLRYEEQILNLDKLLDYGLGQIGKKGSLGEKLKNSNKVFKNINGVWNAHKLRNKIAHEIGIRVSDSDFKYAKKEFMKAFRDLGV